jgi:hypothetical protein
MHANRLLGFVVFVAVLAGFATALAAHETPIVCTNPASGTQWQIRIDYDKRTVDANSARFSATEISWRDMHDGSNYTLNRKSGDLTMVAASSTGGYFLHHRCKL